MNKNKKALSMTFVVTLIISIVFLLIFYSYQSGILKTAQYESKILECETFMNGVEGKALFFSNDLSKPTFTLLNSISQICPLKTEEISKNSLDSASELVQNCYREGGSGVDIMGANSNGNNICIFCGFLESKEEIENVNEKLVEEFKDEKNKKLFEDKETSNLNKYFLNEEQNIPNSISQNNPIAVIYISHKIEEYKSDAKDNFLFDDLNRDADEIYESTKTEVSKLFGEMSPTLNQFLSSANTQTLTGVYLQSWDYDNHIKDLVEKESPTINPSNYPLNINCQNLVIPINSFD